jgi:hypothetical protein
MITFRFLLLAIGEQLCLLFSFALLIPPIPSVEGQVYEYPSPLSFVALVLFALSHVRNAKKRGKWGWLELVLHSAAFFVLGWVINYRVFG